MSRRGVPWMPRSSAQATTAWRADGTASAIAGKLRRIITARSFVPRTAAACARLGLAHDRQPLRSDRLRTAGPRRGTGLALRPCVAAAWVAGQGNEPGGLPLDALARARTG